MTILKKSFFLFAALLYGCALGPDFTAPDDILGGARLTLDGRELASTLSEEEVPPAWWTLFGDETLNELQARADAGNLDLRAAELRIEQSRAQFGISTALLFPTLSGRAGYTWADTESTPSSGRDNWQFGFDAGWELDLWGKNRRNRESALAQAQATVYEREAVRVSLSAEIARGYISLRGIQTQIEITRANEALALSVLKIAQSKELYGTGTRYEVATASAQVASIRASLVALERQLEGQMNALALLVGEPPRSLNGELSGKVSVPELPDRVPAGLPSGLARRRPDILQAEALLHAATADIGAAEADFYPTISLGGSFGFASHQLDDLGNWDTRSVSIGPSLYLPIFQGGRLTRTLELTKAKHKSAAVAYRQVVLKAWHEVDDALALYAAEQRRRKELRQAFEESRQAFTIARRLYEEGQQDYLYLLSAQRELLANESSLNESVTQAAVALTALYKALGGGWDSSLFAEDVVRDDDK